MRERPVAVLVELSSKCNYRCLSCPHSVYRQDIAGAPFNRSLGFMDFNLFKQVIADASTIAKTINFSFFGEPMLHPHFLDCIEYVKQTARNNRIVLFTNMSCATREIMRALTGIKRFRIRMSVDAATSSTYEHVRPGRYCLDLDGNRCDDRRFDAICDKIEYWFKIKNHPGSRHTYVVSSRNIHELEAYAKRWLPLLGKHDDILAKSMITYGGTMLNDTFLNRQPCRIWSKEPHLVVDWQGNVSPCVIDTNMDLKIGHVPTQRLIEIWRSPAYKRTRELSQKKLIVPCDTCIDGNNRSRDLCLRRGDSWKPQYLQRYKPTSFSDLGVQTPLVTNENSHSNTGS